MAHVSEEERKGVSEWECTQIDGGLDTFRRAPPTTGQHTQLGLDRSSLSLHASQYHLALGTLATA